MAVPKGVYLTTILTVVFETSLSIALDISTIEIRQMSTVSNCFLNIINVLKLKLLQKKSSPMVSFFVSFYEND